MPEEKEEEEEESEEEVIFQRTDIDYNFLYEFGYPIKKNQIKEKEIDGEIVEVVGRITKYPKLLEKPEPYYVDGKKHCRLCYERDSVFTPLHHKSFLCSKHMKEYKREKEKLRQRAKRKENREAGIKEYKLKLGTSDFSFEMCKTTDGTPDPEREQEVVRNELNRIMDEKTIGDIKYKKQGYWEEEEEEEETIDEQNDW